MSDKEAKGFWTVRVQAFIDQVLEEFATDATPCWDFDKLPERQFWDIIEAIEEKTGLTIAAADK